MSVLLHCRSQVAACVLAFFAAGLTACGNSSSALIDEPQAPSERQSPPETSVGNAIVVGNIQPQGDPLVLLSAQQLDPRLLELIFSTPAIPPNTSSAPSVQGGTHVRVLVPADYQQSTRRYPVVYLLHGALDDYTGWTAKLQAEETTAGVPVIAVMPDGGQLGEYSDYYNQGMFGPPDYETYHVQQLIPWIDANFRTIATREGRAIAGVSMGGFGAMSYAARHPDLFVSAAAFSGAVDTNYEPMWPLILDTIWGDRGNEEIRWRGSNPVDLAMNLGGIALSMRTGNGMIGGDQQVFDPVEFAVHQESVDLHNTLTTLGIPHLWDDYGPGGHAAQYWIRDFQQTLPDMMKVFAAPPSPPAMVNMTAIAPSFGAYGWQVEMTRSVLEFATLKDASIRGFSLLGSGSAVVITPALYEPATVYAITETNGARKSSQLVTSDSLGHLQLQVDLGAANAYQQYTVPSAGLGAVHSSVISIGKP
jgi:S-formylglutathione hydrolase FrmB